VSKPTPTPSIDIESIHTKDPAKSWSTSRVETNPQLSSAAPPRS